MLAVLLLFASPPILAKMDTSPQKQTATGVDCQVPALYAHQDLFTLEVTPTVFFEPVQAPLFTNAAELAKTPAHHPVTKPNPAVYWRWCDSYTITKSQDYKPRKWKDLHRRL